MDAMMGGGTHLHTPQSIFQHMMSQENDARQWPLVPHITRRLSLWNDREQQPAMNTSSLQLKRKCPETFDERPKKQLITYEKMASQLQGLHISPNCITLDDSDSDPVSKSCCPQSQIVDSEQDTGSPRLIISDEIKRLPHEPILPPSLTAKLERPSMALVLWEPPRKHLRLISTRDTPTPIPSIVQNEDDNENEIDNNNSETVSDFNDPSLNNVVEPMDL